MYPNILLEHGLRAIRRKLLNRTTNVPSTECTVDAVTLCRTCSNIQFKNKHYVPIKGCNQGPKDARDYTDIAMDEVDDLLINFKLNNLALLEYGRYHDDTFTPWSHGLDNLMIFKQALDDFIADIYLTIRFTMSFDFKRIQFLNLNIYVEDGYLKTALFSNPTDNHEDLNVRSWHQDSVFRSIPTTVANRIRRNCTDHSEFTKSRSEYSGYLTNAGSLDKAFHNVKNLSQETLV